MAAVGPRVVGRYALHGQLASGGMATVHLGRLNGPVGFSRIVAIKRMLPQYVSDPDFVVMFLEEARLASRVRHPNVVPVIDVVAADGEVLLVMEYVRGETLSRLLRRVQQEHQRIPPPIVSAIMCEVLEGLHAAHEALDDAGTPLGIVHRDVSPQNIIVGTDGSARVLDFGIAKAIGRAQITREGQLKGKLAYMSPEHLKGKVTRSTDIYAAGVVLWEALANQRLFAGDNEGETMQKILHEEVSPPSRTSGSPREYDDVVLKALSRNPVDRYATAREMAAALAKCAARSEPHEVGEWVESVAKQALELRHDLVSEVETAVTDAGESTMSEIVNEPRRVHRRRQRTWHIVMAGFALVAVSAAVTFAVTRRSSLREGPAVMAPATTGPPERVENGTPTPEFTTPPAPSTLPSASSTSVRRALAPPSPPASKSAAAKASRVPELL